MNKPNRLQDALRALCAETHDDDVPQTRKEQVDNGAIDRKSQALAGQIRKVLERELRLGTRRASPEHVEIVGVRLDREGRAHVAVAFHQGSWQAVQASLMAQRSRLRAEVARVIARKRVPDLRFEPAHPGSSGDLDHGT